MATFDYLTAVAKHDYKCLHAQKTIDAFNHMAQCPLPNRDSMALDFAASGVKQRGKETPND